VRRTWLQVANRIAAGELAAIRCPVNNDGELIVRFIGADPVLQHVERLFLAELGLPEGGSGSPGEWHARCPDCGAETYMLLSARDSD
jgi:hypothetical protein